MHIQYTCHLTPIVNSPIIIYEDNVVCVAQIRGWYIEEDKTKHISPKFFYTHEFQEGRQVNVKQIRSSDNLVNLFTKSLPTSTFKKLIYDIGRQWVNKLQD